MSVLLTNQVRLYIQVHLRKKGHLPKECFRLNQQRMIQMELAAPSEVNESSVSTTEYKQIISRFIMDHLFALWTLAFTWIECKICKSYLKPQNTTLHLQSYNPTFI